MDSQTAAFHSSNVISYDEPASNSTFPNVILHEDLPEGGSDKMGKSADNSRNILTTAKTALKKQTKKEKMLSDPDVKRWYDNVRRGRLSTADARLRRLCHFCEVRKMTPMQFIELATKDIKTATDVIEDHIDWMEKDGRAPGYIRNTVSVVNSWLSHFDIEIKRRLKVANANSRPTLKNEKVPEAAELAEIFNGASKRAGASMSLIGKAGLRPEVLGNYDGTDGLTMKDIPDIVVHNGVAICLSNPPRVIVKPLSKAGHQYFTFLTTQGKNRLLAYLNNRIARGEVLDLESPVIAPDSEYGTYRGENESKKFLPTHQITREIRETFRPRFQWRPYVLRAYFDTQLLYAESRGKIAHDFRVFFMGHKGSIEATYTTNKSILPQALYNEMRDSFKRCEPLLDLEVAETDPFLEQKEQIEKAIQTATPEQLGQMQEILKQIGIGNIVAQAASSA